MHVEVEPKNPFRLYPTPVLQQNAFWAQVKSGQGYGVRAFDVHSDPERMRQGCDAFVPEYNQNATHECALTDLLVVIRDLGPGSRMAYIPYGPLVEPREEERGKYLESLSVKLREHLPPDCLFIRYDLLWESPWAREKDYYTPDGRWIGPPDAEIRELRMNFDTDTWNLHKAPGDVLPANTVYLDLTRPEDELLRRMKPKTRYNVRLSFRRGIQVWEAEPADIRVWYELYARTAERNRIHLDGLMYFRSVLEMTSGNRRSPARIRLLMAGHENEPLAGMFLAIAGGRATYLYGASSAHKRDRMPSYALQWEAIVRARRAGCTEYDMFGVSPSADPSHPMYGLYRFKTGFGGHIFHREGCWDYALDREAYAGFRARELVSRGYHV
ncbi:MAG: peptidoglycan bridge formation glycyltransferase FemA/FemB family protein [Bacteroidales bacterium]